MLSSLARFRYGLILNRYILELSLYFIGNLMRFWKINEILDIRMEKPGRCCWVRSSQNGYL